MGTLESPNSNVATLSPTNGHRVLLGFNAILIYFITDKWSLGLRSLCRSGMIGSNQIGHGIIRAGAGGGAAAWVLLNGTGQEVDGQVIALQRVFSSNGGDSCRVASSSIGVCTRT
ncbi:hypothetical protein RHGRI_001197 [Rhododendron griersonianum]|uniref:Uncharacterized protein n=1 Tax=Rhododendron griersonianum TaxID=479676 RepID=A0AAV6LK78_9ERIC|nr:hypothetical protein RHGRI_001197 [Rhododendron griersonianum]